MLLSYLELVELVKAGVVTETPLDRVNGSSIDITLGSKLLLEAPHTLYELERSVRLGKDKLTTREVVIPEDGYALRPGEFMLAHSQQVFHMPLNVSAEFKLKSSTARLGLEQLNAGWCDPGWNHSALTLELCNVTKWHTIVLMPGDLVGQVVFFSHTSVPKDKSYAVRGKYNGDNGVQGAKL